MRQSLDKFVLPQSCWLRWVPYATACVQWTYVVYLNQGIQWYWEAYLLRDEIKRLVVQGTGTLVEFLHSYNMYNRFNIYGGCFEHSFSIFLVHQTRHILQTIRTTRRHGKCSQQVLVTDQRSGFIPENQFVSVQYLSKNLNCIVLVLRGCIP